jgi:hypothetical protein
MLKTWEARRYEKILETGRTKPLVIECIRSPLAENSEGEIFNKLRKTFVVKTLGNPGVYEIGLFCEVFGNLIARELGINTPEPALIHLSPEFVGVVAPHLKNSGIQLTAGLAAGCEYLAPGLSPVLPGTFLNDDELDQAIRIFGFDLLTQNPDRTRQKADGNGNGSVNCASRSGTLVAFDFELCFSFLFSFGIQPKPWQVSKLPFFQSHIFRQSLQSRTLDFTDFFSRLKSLSSGRLDVLSSDLPEPWRGRASDACEHILQVVKKASQFEVELRRCLK